jgi:4-amino-4-deoxy-L-arabinose transferase-like glycosyltransferase
VDPGLIAPKPALGPRRAFTVACSNGISTMHPIASSRHKLALVSLALVLCVGFFLRLPMGLFADRGPLHSLSRLHPIPKWHQMGFMGFDEELYREYVDELSSKGIRHYPDIVLGYIEKQVKLPGSILPPVRFLYIFTGYLWHSLFGADALDSLRNVASCFGILTLAAAAMFAWRVLPGALAVALTALVAFAPTQIHMSQHALVDGFFTFWALLALWMFWENLQAPKKWGWLAGYTAALALLVLTKENAFFLWIALVIVLVSNRWLRLGTVTRELVVATAIGPLLGVVILILLAGGADVLFGTYRLLITKNYHLPYAIKTGDGPWYRYLLDLMLVSPVILLLAIGAVFQINRSKRFDLFLLTFIAGSYLVMCNVKYGMNLRYANMWDVPLRFLALGMVVSLTEPLQKWSKVGFAVAIGLICALELRQYIILFVNFPLYELVTEGLLRALHILK